MRLHAKGRGTSHEVKIIERLDRNDRVPRRHESRVAGQGTSTVHD